MRVSKLFIIAWVFSTLINASLPPTTLSGQSSATKPTTFTFKAPYSQATQISGIESLIETGDENMLVDPGMESSGVSAYTCTVGTCTKTTVSGEFSSGKQALKVALSSQAMNVSQTVNTPLGIQKQGYVRVLYRVPATMADFQICSIVNSAEQTCVPTNNLIKDDTFRSIEIPLIFNATNAGIKFKTTLSYSGNAFFDAAVVAQGLGTQNLMLDNTYSAQMSSGGVISGENKDWINGNCTGTAPYNCTLVSNVFSSTPNCTITSAEAGVASSARVGTINTSLTTSSQLSFTLHQSGVGNVASAAVITCQKSGNDYLAASSSVYSQASGNYDWTSYTATFTGLGAVSPSTNNCKHKREGGDLLVDCRLTSIAPAASLVSISLPNSLILDSTKIIAANITTAAGQAFGTWTQDALGGYGSIVTATGTSTSVVYTGQYISAANQLIPQNGTSAFVNSITSFRFRVPISGWSNAAMIVGSFAGVPTVPGYQGNVDTFSVSYGTTNATTACTGSPCFVDQIGTSVTNITRAAIGNMTMNVPVTYSKLKCILSVAAISGSGVGLAYIANNLQCSSCNSLQFTSTNTSGTSADSFGTLMCQGLR